MTNFKVNFKKVLTPKALNKIAALYAGERDSKVDEIIEIAAAELKEYDTKTPIDSIVTEMAEGMVSYYDTDVIAWIGDNVWEFNSYINTYGINREFDLVECGRWAWYTYNRDIIQNSMHSIIAAYIAEEEDDLENLEEIAAQIENIDYMSMTLEEITAELKAAEDEDTQDIQNSIFYFEKLLSKPYAVRVKEAGHKHPKHTLTDEALQNEIEDLKSYL